MADLAVLLRERVVGDLADERLDEGVLAPLGERGSASSSEQLAPDEPAEPGSRSASSDARRPRRGPARLKLWPSTAASATRARSAGSRPSRRAAMRAVRVSGTATSSRSPTGPVRARPRARAGPGRGASGPSRPRRAGCRRRARRSRRPPARAGPGRGPRAGARMSAGGSGSRWIEVNDRLPGAPVRSPIEQLRPGERDDGDRDAAAPLQEVVDEVEQARVGVVQVLEDHDDRRGLRPAARRTSARRRTARPSRSRRRRRAGRAGRARSSGARPDRRRGSATVSAIRARVVASSSLSASPARPRTISPRAQNVMPSPYAGLRPACHQTVSSEAVEVLQELPGKPGLADAGRAR